MSDRWQNDFIIVNGPDFTNATRTRCRLETSAPHDDRMSDHSRRLALILSFRTLSWFAVALALSSTALAGQSEDAPSTTAAPAVATHEQPADAPASSPLAIHIGDSEFVIGGFMDATVITRSTNAALSAPIPPDLT
jgi:hypothetical protein